MKRMTPHQPAEYAEEAKQRWGDTPAYRESARRTAAYTEQDWARIHAAAADLGSRLARALEAGTPAESEAAMDLAEEHRRQISEFYYDCSYEIQRGLAQMYVADERFLARYEAIAPGLTQYLHDAILANAERAA